jgi:hypothetical protein
MANDLGELLVKLSAEIKGLEAGLSQAKSDLQGFQGYVRSFSDEVKSLLTFAGIGIGIYELASSLKEFATTAAMTGARTETLQIAATKIGETYGMSADAVRYYVDQTKAAGITTQEALTAVSKFLTSGLPLDQLKEVATRARDIGVVAGVNTSEALGRMVQGIVSGEVEVLRRLMIQIPNVDQLYKQYAATLGTTADQLNQVQKRQAVLDAVMTASAGFAGVAAEADATVGKQLASMARFAEEARNALWALFEPIMLQGVQDMTQAWKNLKDWADANRASLIAWGQEIAGWVRELTGAIRTVVQFVQEHQTLIKTALALVVFSKAADWIKGFGGALAGTSGTITTAGKEAGRLLATLTTLVGGPWKIAIAVTLFGLTEAYREIKNIQAQATIPGTTRPGFLWPWQVSTETQASVSGSGGSSGGVPSSLRGKLTLEDLKKAGVQASLGDYLKTVGPDLTELYKAQAQGAQKKAEAESPKLPLKEGGAGGKETIDSLLAPYLSMLKAQRDADLQAAKNSLDLLKSTNDLKRAELERALAAQEIDGATYYQRLQELEQQETTAALAMIDQKRAAQQKAYQDSLTQLNADQKLSPEAKEIATQKLAAENKKALLMLDAEAAKVRLDGEVKVTEELKRQAQIRIEYQQKTEDLNLETAQLLGAVSEQEATLQKLYLDWQRAKQDAISKGAYTPEYAAALDKNLEAKQDQARWGGYAGAITSGISDLADAITSGGQTLMQAAKNIFKNLFNEAMQPGLDALKNLLIQGFKSLFGETGSALASAIMGVIGLVGMLLTSGSGSSSFSASGVTSTVTSHEAVRGIIAGETSIPIGELNAGLQEALLPTNEILSQIEQNTRGSGGSGNMGVTVNATGLQKTVKDSIKDIMDEYFRDVYMKASRA